MGIQSNGWAAQPMSKSFPSAIHIDGQEGAMKAPGRRAQPGGKKLIAIRPFHAFSGKVHFERYRDISPDLIDAGKIRVATTT